MIVAVERGCRAIERVSAGRIAHLNASGALPRLSAEVETLGRRGTRREPRPEEVAGYRWLIVRYGDTVEGVVAYEDRFDPHIGGEARHVRHIAGSAAACYRLIKHLAADCMRESLPMFGTIDMANFKMAQFISRLGWVSERMTWVAP